MGLMRSVLLAGSESVWLREHAVRWSFVKRATSRFMPGERLEDALGAARELAPQGIAAILTHLGENVADEAEARAVADDYVHAQEQVKDAGVDAEMSVKLTQLGLDLGLDACYANLKRIAEHAATVGRTVWIDMEGSAYTDVTLDVYRRLKEEGHAVGVAVQAYLHRTGRDLETLIPLGAAVRLVKGAYNEPPNLAMQSKAEVDENYFRLGARLLSDEARRAGVFLGLGTHDPVLIRRFEAHVAANDIPKDSFEFEMLYGIKREEQFRLASSGYRIRVLISYGAFWFPWYMRRLAERPANVWFVAKNIFGG